MIAEIPIELHNKIKMDAAFQSITIQKWMMRAIYKYMQQRDVEMGNNQKDKENYGKQ